MARIDIPSGDGSEVEIKSVAGSLQIKGWDEESIRIEVRSQDDLHYEADDNSLSLSCDSDCILRVPEESTIHLKSVTGDAYISYIEGTIQVDSVGGSLTLKSVGTAGIGNIAGNLTVRGVEGELSADEVSGNASLRDVEGDLDLKEVHANLNLRGVEGNVEAKSDGNADLRLDTETDMDYHVEAGGNLFCYLGDEADADVSLESGAGSIQVFTSEGRQSLKTQKHELVLGEGGSDIQLKAGGHIDFRCTDSKSNSDFDLDLDFVEDMNSLADEISEQVSAQVEGQLESLNAQLEGMKERLRQSGDRAAQNATRRVEAAQRKLQHKLQHKIRGPHGRIISMAHNLKTAEPVSDKERMLILQMVQEKKVSVQEAEMLLNTLEGRASAPEAPMAPTPPKPPTPPTPPTLPAPPHEKGE